MPKQKIEIEVDVPEGWEVTGEFRGPMANEPYIDSHGNLGSCPSDCSDVHPRIILRKKYVPPSWLKPGTWLYRTGGTWWTGDRCPVPYPSTWNKNRIDIRKTFGIDADELPASFRL